MFDVLLDTLRANNVPAFLVRKLFEQLFSFVNVQVRWGQGSAHAVPQCRQPGCTSNGLSRPDSDTSTIFCRCIVTMFNPG